MRRACRRKWTHHGRGLAGRGGTSDELGGPNADASLAPNTTPVSDCLPQPLQRPILVLTATASFIVRGGIRALGRRAAVVERVPASLRSFSDSFRGARSGAHGFIFVRQGLCGSDDDLNSWTIWQARPEWWYRLS